MKFSKDPQKVEAIKAAEPPRNAKELNSFLCTVQYNARFMERYAPQTNLLRTYWKPKFLPGGSNIRKRSRVWRKASLGLFWTSHRTWGTYGWLSVRNCGNLGLTGVEWQRRAGGAICKQGPLRCGTELFSNCARDACGRFCLQEIPYIPVWLVIQNSHRSQSPQSNSEQL